MGVSKVTITCDDGTILHGNYQNTADCLYPQVFRTREEADAHKHSDDPATQRVELNDATLEAAWCHIDYGGGMRCRVLICRQRMLFLPNDIDRCPRCAQFCFTGPAEHWSDGVWDCPEPFDLFGFGGTP